VTRQRRRKSQRPERPRPSNAPTPSSVPPPSSGTGTRKKRRRRARQGSRAPESPRTAPARSHTWLPVVAVGLSLATVLLGPLLFWGALSGPGNGSVFTLDVPVGMTGSELTAKLGERGAVASPHLFQAYLGLLHPTAELAPGAHLLNDAASPHELVARLTRSSARPAVRVAVPEGFHFAQVADRLERAEVCSSSAFRSAVNDSALLRELGISGVSAEGYLFPATYGLLADSDAHAVVRVFVEEAKRRLQKLLAAHPGSLQKLAAEQGFSERDVLTLASIIEKEAHEADERPVIASVFFNRLKDSEFRPARMLQSDPTASYGCIALAEQLPSCADFHGTVTPALLRDAQNPYNTYRHPGLPPGPIANPGESSIEAVLAPAQTDYLYFVAKGGGRHAFSRTFSEHREAIEAPH